MVYADSEMKKSHIIPVSAKIIFGGRELGFPRINIIHAITISTTIIFPPNILLRIQTTICMNNLWMNIPEY